MWVVVVVVRAAGPGGGAAVTVVWRVVVVVVSGVLSHETSVRAANATTPLNNIAFFIK
jgi:hypothetical protein